MIVLSSNLNREKNKISTASAWIMLIELEIGSIANWPRLAANNQDVIFNGYTYSKSLLKLDPIKSTSKGEIPQFSISVENISLQFNSILEAYSGLVDYVANIYRVNSAYLTEDYSTLTTQYSILSVTQEEQWVVFTLGAANPMKKRYPFRRFVSQYCNWTAYFKGVECKYSGPEQVCDGSYARCRYLGNTLNFGGFPGLSPQGLRVV